MKHNSTPGVPGLGDGAERRVEAKAAGLRWCRHCGEGTVAGLCRKGLPAGQCPMDAPAVSGVSASDGETVSPAPNADRVKDQP